MIYNLEFKQSTLKEWNTLDNSIKSQFKKKLHKVLTNPHVPVHKLLGFQDTDVYKIKLKSSAYRLLYTVCDNTVTVTVISVGKRDKNLVYKTVRNRI